MTRDDLVTALAALEDHFSQVVDEKGRRTDRVIYRCSFVMPIDWQLPTADAQHVYQRTD